MRRNDGHYPRINQKTAHQLGLCNPRRRLLPKPWASLSMWRGVRLLPQGEGQNEADNLPLQRSLLLEVKWVPKKVVMSAVQSHPQLVLSRRHQRRWERKAIQNVNNQQLKIPSYHVHVKHGYNQPNTEICVLWSYSCILRCPHTPFVHVAFRLDILSSL